MTESRVEDVSHPELSSVAPDVEALIPPKLEGTVEPAVAFGAELIIPPNEGGVESALSPALPPIFTGSKGIHSSARQIYP